MNCNNTARIHNQVQSDIDTLVDDDDAHNNECDPDFSIPLKVNDTKMQCDDEYHKLLIKSFHLLKSMIFSQKAKKRNRRRGPRNYLQKRKKIAKKHNSTK